MMLIDALVEIGFAKSRREARHLIEAGAVSLSWSARAARHHLQRLTERLEQTRQQTPPMT